MPDENEAMRPGRIALGVVLGFVLGAVCFVIAICVGLAIGSPHQWIFPLLNAFLLAGAFLLALKNYSDSGLARGIVIALSLVFILNTICGIVYIR
jgi:hypothetical protein